MTDSCWYMAEAITILISNYPLKIFRKEWKKSQMNNKNKSLKWYVYNSIHCLALSEYLCACVCMLFLQLCSNLCNPMDYSCQGTVPMEVSRQEYWSRLLCPSPGYLPNPGSELASLTSPALTGRFFNTSTTWKSQWVFSNYLLVKAKNKC